jgi:hypothetical protein
VLWHEACAVSDLETGNPSGSRVPENCLLADIENLRKLRRRERSVEWTEPFRHSENARLSHILTLAKLAMPLTGSLKRLILLTTWAGESSKAQFLPY